MKYIMKQSKPLNQVLEIMGPTIFKRTRVGMTELIYPRRCKSIFSGKDEDVFVGFMDGKVQRVYFKKSSNDYLGQ